MLEKADRILSSRWHQGVGDEREAGQGGGGGSGTLAERCYIVFMSA